MSAVLLTWLLRPGFGVTTWHAAATPAAAEFKLTAADGANGHNFGQRVAISGNTAVVRGGHSVYVFVRDGAGWALRQQLGGGSQVAIDGDTIAVAQNGLISVFVRSGATWVSQQTIDVPGAFAHSLALRGDTMLLGDMFDSEGCPAGNCGAAYVFVRSGATWTRQQKLTAGSQSFSASAVIPADPNVWFGSAVAVRGDTALIGANGDNFTTGAVYVFVRDGETWTQQQKLTASDRNFNHLFGSAVALDEDTAVIGAHGAGGGVPPGFAYVFTRAGTTWAERQKLRAGDGEEGDLFGQSVAISRDLIVVGNYPEDTGDPSVPPRKTGSAYVFKFREQAWAQQQKLNAGDGVPGDFFGSAVAVSDGTALVGAFRDDTPRGTDAGSAYVFEVEPDTTPPSLSVPPDTRVETTGSAGAVVSYSVSASDNRDPDPAVVCTPASGSTFAVGTTLVSCTATDASNNSARASFNVNVVAVEPPPSPTPNPCLTSPGPPSGSFRKSVALGAAPAVRISDIGGTQDLLYRYASNDSLCPTNVEELDPASNIRLLRESGTAWVRLWTDWASLQPYSSVDLEEFQALSPEQLAARSRDLNDSVRARTARWLINLDGQIRTARKEKLQVILTLHHRYPLWANNSRVGVRPLPNQSDEYGNIPGCDDNCQRANDRVTANENVRRQRRNEEPLKLRDAFGRVPTNLDEGSPWGRWVRFLVVRYGATRNKTAADRDVCSYSFNDSRCGDYLRYVDFLEIVNEPNITHWPQRNPDKVRGTRNLVMPGYVALMFRTAKAIVDRQNAELSAGGQLDQVETTIRLLGPATSDSSEASYKRTPYYEFSRELFKWLKAMRFRPGPHVAWSHHNYGDVEYARHDLSRPGRDPDQCSTNSAAWTRKLLKDGSAGYRWEGWPRGGNNPELLITEGGARLELIPRLWNVRAGDVASIKGTQALLVADNFNRMNAGPLSNGIAMTNNYLTYSDPRYDTGLLDSSGGSCADWQARADCTAPGRQRVACRGFVDIRPCACTGVAGARRPLYEAWKTLQPSR